MYGGLEFFKMKGEVSLLLWEDKHKIIKNE